MSRGPRLKNAKAQVIPSRRIRPMMEKDFVLVELTFSLLLHCHGECDDGEDEHYSVVTNVHPLVDNSIRAPAPANRE